MNSKETNIYTFESESETTVSEIYKSGREHLMDELCKLDALIQLQVLKLREQHFDKRIDEFAGLYITEEEVDQVLGKELKSQDRGDPSTEDSERMVLLNQIESLQTRISERVEESLKCGIFLPLYQLSYLFHLTPLELDTILVCLAPELNLKYETLYAYLQNDVTKKHPGINLTLDLLCNTDEERIDARTYFYSQAPLLKYSLIRFVDDTKQKPLLSRGLKLDDRIANFLFEFNLQDIQINSFAEFIKPKRDWSTVLLDDELKKKLSRLAKEHFKYGIGNKLIFYFCGPYGAGKKLVAEVFCQDLQHPLIIVDTRDLLHTEIDVGKTVRLLFREALLQRAAIYLEHFGRLITDDPRYIRYQSIIVKAIEEFSTIEEFPLVTFLAGEKPWNPPASAKKQRLVKIDFPIPPYSLRKRLWKQLLDGQYSVSPEVDTDVLANKFRFTGGQIQDAVAEAKNFAMMHQSEDNGSITMDDLYRSCRAQSNQKLSELAQKIVPHYILDDIVLPSDKVHQLEEICNYVKYRQLVYDEWGFDRKISLGKGLNALFSGPSGTGKTMAAEIIANELKLDLYKIDLSSVVSKYIGETEKNLAKIFKEAETSNAILFFDEADALFGKRSEVKDSHDRYANIEIGYLLQKMEEYTGLAILATNMQKNMDEAFVRRMHFSVEFPFPEWQYRLCIWQKIFPKARFKLTESSFQELSKVIPDNVLERLKDLQDREFTKDKLMKKVEECIGKEQAENHKELILEHVFPKARFKLTESSFQELSKVIPEDVLESLKNLLGDKEFTKDKLLKILEEQIGKKQAEEYKELILKHTVPKYPEETPLDLNEKDDFKFMAQKFNITGGNIKNIALAAAFYAAADGKVVTMRHLIQATKREFQKMGKLCIKSDFEGYYDWIA